MAKPSNPIPKFASAIAAACSPLGIKAHEIVATARSISIPSAGLSVSAELSNGVRVWRCESRMTVRSAVGGEDVSVPAVLFEEPFEREWQVARRMALHLAEIRIDAAIDAANAAAWG